MTINSRARGFLPDKPVAAAAYLTTIVGGIAALVVTAPQFPTLIASGQLPLLALLTLLAMALDGYVLFALGKSSRGVFTVTTVYVVIAILFPPIAGAFVPFIVRSVLSLIARLSLERALDNILQLSLTTASSSWIYHEAVGLGLPQPVPAVLLLISTQVVSEVLTIPYLRSIDKVLKNSPTSYFQAIALEGLGVLLATAHWTWWQIGLAAAIGVLGGGALVRSQRDVSEAAERLAVEQQQRFLVGIAHDLRTPVAAMRTCVDAMRQGPRAELLVAVADEVRTLELLVEYCLGVGRSSNDERRCDLGDVLIQCRSALPAGAAERLVIDAPKSVRVDLSPLEAYRAIQNLIVNAIRYSSGQVRISVRIADGLVVIAVSDDGEGIPAADLARVFRPFERGAGGREQGAGLGLALVREIAEGAKGQVTYIPGEGRGSTFELSLPASAPQSDS